MSTITPSDTNRWTLSHERFRGASENPFWRRFVAWSWVVSFMMPLLFVAWLHYDGYASRSLSGTWIDLLDNRDPEPLSTSLIGPRLLWVQIIAIVAGSMGAVTLLSFLIGPKQFRGIRSLLGFLLLSGGWLLILTQWDRIHHLGRAALVCSESRSVTGFADRINQNWNALVKNLNNESQFELSSFNAYPIYKPTMMMFLGDQAIPNSPLLFRAIEREENRAIRFELSGENLGYWIERRYDQKEPSDFVGGLSEAYQVGRYRQIADQLYLVDFR